MVIFPVIYFWLLAARSFLYLPSSFPMHSQSIRGLFWHYLLGHLIPLVQFSCYIEYCISGAMGPFGRRNSFSHIWLFQCLSWLSSYSSCQKHLTRQLASW